jgi:hypothetical protein
MGIFKRSCSRGSSVSTVIRLPEAHTLLCRCGMQTGSRANRAWYQQIIARTFLWGKSVGVEFTIHLHLVPKQKIRGVAPPFPTCRSWCLIQHRDEFTFFLTFWATLSRCASQSLVNTSHTNIIHKLYTMVFIIHCMFQPCILTIIRWNRGTEEKVLHKRPTLSQSIC